MADFRIQKFNAQVVQNAERIQNCGPVIRELPITASAKAQLQDLLADIAALTQSGAVSHEVGHELRISVLTAADEADAPAPRWHRVTSALNHAKEIAVGLTAAASLAESVDAVVRTLGGGA